MHFPLFSPVSIGSRFPAALLGLATALLHVAPAPLAAAEPVWIAPIGDSITQGGKKDREEYTYRLPLFQMLTDEGIAFDFIGSRTKGLQGEATWPDYKGKAFDPDHEGYYGIKTAALLEKLPEAMKQWPAAPDIALIHLGTNDQKSDDFTRDVVKPLEGIIALLRAKNPRVVVLVGHLNFNGGSAIKIRPLVEEMAQRLDTPDSPVRTVAHYQGWKENPQDPQTDTFDWAHPNPQGQRKMADRWLAAMRPFLPAPAGK